MDVRFRDEDLADACETERACRKRFGKNYRLLLVRLASLRAAVTLSDMSNVPGRIHALHGDREGQFAVHLWGAVRLVFEPADNPVPRKEDGGVDISKVTAVRIVEVIDYHGR